MLTNNFAGADNKYEDEDISPDVDGQLKDNLTHSQMNVSKYQYLNQKGELGYWATLFTFIKVNIVAGFLFLPLGFKNGGWLFSIIAIFLINLIVIYCNISISECTDAAASFSFSRIGYKACGKVGFYCVEFGIAFSQVSINILT